MRLPAVVTRAIEGLWHDADRGMRAALLDAVPHDSSANLLDVGCHDGSFTRQVAARLGVPLSQVAESK